MSRIYSGRVTSVDLFLPTRTVQEHRSDRVYVEKREPSGPVETTITVILRGEEAIAFYSIDGAGRRVRITVEPE